jgi:N-acetylmuramoyl-L-alanine amidase
VTLKSDWTHFQFEVNSRRATINGMTLWLHGPLRKIRRHWSLSEVDVQASIDPLLRPQIYLNDLGSRVVVLDPGHGGKDRGARGHRAVEEKRVVLDVAKRARAHLANAGLKVYLTRDVDRQIPLRERTQKAAAWNADIFVSIHCNASATAGAEGIETYVVTSSGHPSTNARNQSRPEAVSHRGNKYETANTILGYYLQRSLLRHMEAKDRGLRRARFLVLREAPCPAALVELGFLSNRREEELFLAADYREKAARALANGIIDYVSAVKRAHVAIP